MKLPRIKHNARIIDCFGERKRLRLRVARGRMRTGTMYVNNSIQTTRLQNVQYTIGLVTAVFRYPSPEALGFSIFLFLDSSALSAGFSTSTNDLLLLALGAGVSADSAVAIFREPGGEAGGA